MRVVLLAFGAILLGCHEGDSDAATPTEPLSIVLFHDPATGAGWDVDALLAVDPYDYPNPEGQLRDAVQRYLQDGIERMTGQPAPIRNSADLEAEPAHSVLIVLFDDAPDSIRDDAAIQDALGRDGGAEPDYIDDRESYYLRSAGDVTWVVANTVDGLTSAMPELLGSVGYDVLGLGPNWVYAPDFTQTQLRFDIDQGFQNHGYTIRRVGGFGAGGEDSLTVQFDLVPPDEDVTRSFSRWRVGMRMNAAQSVPYFPGDAMDSYADAVLQHMRDEGVDDGFLNEHTAFGELAARPPAGPDTDGWLWLDTDDERAFASDGQTWTETIPSGVGFSIDLSTPWVRELLLGLMIDQADVDAWEHPDEWSVFATQPEDGNGYAHFAETVHDADWYPAYRAAQGQTWDAYVLHGFQGVDQPTETWDPAAPSDTVFATSNWLLREYDAYVDALPPGPQTDPATPTQQTRTGKDRKALIRCGLESYNYNDVPPHFNLDHRIRVVIGGYPKHRGNAEWPMMQDRPDLARALAVMLPDEPLANFATVSDWGWDPDQMTYVLPHLWGNSSADVLAMYQPFTDAGIRSWYGEMEMGYTQHALGIYLMGRYLWDPSLDEEGLDALRDRWLVEAFGEAGAVPMRAYFDFTNPANSPDVANSWGRAMNLLNTADLVIPPGTDAQRRLDDVKQFWYFYFLMDTGRLVASDAATRELMWKGQSAYTACMYLLGWYVFGGQWVADMPELVEPIDYTAGPAHYTPEETATWWAAVDAHWPYTPVASWADFTLVDGTPATAVDVNDLVPMPQSDEPSGWDALGYDAWDVPFVQALSVAAPGDEVGFQLLWPAYDPRIQEYFGPHDTSWRIERWDATAQRWEAVGDGFVRSVRVDAADNWTGGDAWYVVVREPVDTAGTYRVTIGYGGIGSLASLDWDIREVPAALADDHGLTFTQRLVLDAQQDGTGMFVYIPKGVTSLDFEITDPDVTFGKTLRLYQGFAVSDATTFRDVDVTARGTWRVALEPGEDGSIARFDLGGSSFSVPYLYSIPTLWARSPSALLVPRAIALADGLPAAR